MEIQAEFYDYRGTLVRKTTLTQDDDSIYYLEQLGPSGWYTYHARSTITRQNLVTIEEATARATHVRRLSPLGTRVILFQIDLHLMIDGIKELAEKAQSQQATTQAN